MNYTDIWEMPVYCWFKVLTEHNFGFLYKSSLTQPPNKVKHDESRKALKVWFDLNDQFISEFGQDELTVDLLEKKRDLGILIGEYLESGNKFKLTQIEIKRLDIDRFEGDEKFNPTKEVGIISKYIGQPINTKKVTVHEYYTLKETLKSEK